MYDACVGDARFYARSGPYNVAEIAAAANGTAAKSERVLTGVAPLQTAGPDEVSFLDNRRYAEALEGNARGCCDRASRYGGPRAVFGGPHRHSSNV
jgi:UDP-3-O-[3-hydroxymyristoyl] glucosamine N-acyltransferase